MAYACSLLLAFAAGALAVPISNWEEDVPRQCALTCPTASKFLYQPDTAYEYAYETNVKTSMPGANTEHSSLHLRATAHIQMVSQCDMVLTLSDVTLMDSDPSDYVNRQQVDNMREFRRALQAAPLQFAFLDGHVTHVCPAASEAAWVLNIKRGILSVFQNTMDKLDVGMESRETDVAGDCPVIYKVMSGGRVVKEKNLLACMHRNGYDTVFQGSPYTVDSGIQSLPLMKTTHYCEQHMTGEGLLASGACAEKHVFRPFSVHHNGAVTDVDSKLTYVGASPAGRVRTRKMARRAALTFEHEMLPGGMADNYEQDEQLTECTNVLMEMCNANSNANDIRPEMPRLFALLVKQMRTLNVDNLMKLRQYLMSDASCPHALKYFYDAIPTIGSDASVNLIRQMVLSNDIAGMDAEIWLTSLAFIPTPTLAMLGAVKPLAESNHPARKAIVAISSLVHNYCTRINVHCYDEPDVRAIMEAFVKNLRYNCHYDDDEQFDAMRMSLKAIGNMGYGDQSCVNTLARCLTNEDIAMEMRVASINAYRRMSCSADRSTLTNLLQDTMADAELRINAYLALMQCASADVIAVVSGLLAAEQSNQVGSFIWTHLTNLKETSAPLKQAVRAILEDAMLKRAFDIDKRKFSRNIEWSAFNEAMNAGAALESNLIWSAKSYVPRSAMANLKLDLFGETIDLLELGGRVEGLEGLLESLFGQAGQTENMFGEGGAAADTPMNAIATLAQKFRVPDAGKPKASYYLKIFGNEIRYDDLHNIDLESFKDKFNYLDWLLELAEEKKIDIHKSIMFLDSTINIPTAAGMPLRLRVDGTATVDIQVKGKMDMRQLITNPRAVDIVGFVKPSAAVEIAGTMGVDAFITRTGLRMVSTVHTSLYADGTIQLTDGKVFNMDINWPDDKIELISVESKFYVAHRGGERAQSMLDDNRIELKSCTPDSLLAVTGLKACGELSLPRPYAVANSPWFPFTGPASAKLYILKRDSHTGYHFDAKFAQDMMRGADGARMISSDVARVSFNTPGSRVNRELTAEMNLNRLEGTLSALLRTPWKAIELNGELVNDAGLKRFKLRSLTDNTHECGIMAMVTINPKKYGAEYIPRLEITMPRRSPIQLGGKVFYRQAKKLEVNLNLQNAFQDPVEIVGDIQLKKNPYKLTGAMNIQSALIEGTFKGYVVKANADDNSMSSRLEMVYSYRSGPKQRIVIDNKLRDQSTKALMDYGLTSSLESSLWPRYNGQLSTGFTKSNKVFTSMFQGGFDPTRRVNFVQNLNYAFRKAKNTLKGDVKIVMPFAGIDVNADLAHSHMANELQTMANIKYGGGRTGLFDLMLKKLSASPLQTECHIKLQYPGREMSLKQTLMERPAGEYQQVLTAMLQKYETVVITSNYKMRPRHEFTTDITMGHMPPINIAGHLRPNLRNMQAYAGLTYGAARHRYGATANWRRTGEIDTNVNGELLYPARRITVEGSVKGSGGGLYSGELKTNWDADNAAALCKASLLGSVTASMAKPTLALRAELYGKLFVDIQANCQYSTGSWINSATDLAGNVVVLTSIPGWKRTTVALKHDWAANKMKTIASIQLRESDEYNADLDVQMQPGWDQVNAVLTVNTPLRGFTTNVVTLQYKLAGNGLTANLGADWDGQKIMLSMQGQSTVNSRRTAVDAAVTLTTPFAGFETISSNVLHNYDGKLWKTKMDTAWARTQGFSFDYTLNMPVGWREFDGKLIVSTPMDAFRKVFIACNNNYAEKEMGATAEIVNAQSAKLGAVMSFGMPGGWAAIKADLTVNTLIPSMPVIVVKVQNHCTPQKVNAMFDAVWGNGPKLGAIIDLNIPRGWAGFDGELTVFTPYGAIPQIAINGRHSFDGATVQAALTGTWGGGRNIVGDVTISLPRSGINDYKAVINVATPFNGYRANKIDITAKMIAGEVVFTADAICDAKEITLGISGKRDNSWRACYAKFFLTSPFRGVEDIRAEYKHAFVPGNIETYIKAIWAPHRQIGATLNLVHAGHGVGLTTEGNLKIMTPYVGYENIEATWNHAIVQTKLTSMINVLLEGNALVGANMEFNYGRTARAAELSGLVNLALPVIYPENIIVNFDYSTMSAAEKAHISCRGSVQWAAGKVINYEHNIDVVPLSSVKVLAKITSPIPGMEEIVLDVTARILAAGGLSFKKSFKWAPGKAIGMEARMTNDGALEGFGRFTSPFSPVENLELNFSNRRNAKGVRNVHADFDYGAARKLEFDTVIGMGQFKKIISLQIKSAVPYMKTVRFEVKVNGVPRDFSVDVDIAHELLRKKITAKITANTKDLSNVECLVDVRSPCPVVPVFRAHVTHAMQGHLRWVSNAELVIANYKMDALHDMTINSPVDFNTKTKVEYGAGKLIEFDIDYKQMPSEMHVAVNLKSPCPHLEDIRLRVNHEGQWNNFECSAELMFAEGKKIDATTEFRFASNKVNGLIRVATPFADAREMQVKLNHAGGWTDFKNQLALRLNKKRFVINNEVTISGTDMIKAKVNIITPFTGFETIGLDVDYKGPWTNMHATAALTYPNCAINVRCELQVDGRDVNGLLQLSTPFAVARNMQVEFKHDSRRGMNFQNSATIALNGHEFRGKSELRWVGNTLRGHVQANVPEAYILEVNHEGGINKFENTAKLRYRGGQMSGSSSFRMADKGVEVHAEVKTPYANMEHSAVNAHYNKEDSGFSGSAYLDTSIPGYEHFGTVLEHSRQPTKITTTAKLESPFATMRSAEFNLKHEGQRSDFNTEVSTKYNREHEITAGASYKNTGRRMDATAHIHTPYSSFPGSGVVFTHKAKNGGFVEELAVQTPIPGYENMQADAKYHPIHNGHSAEISVDTPMYGKKKFSAEISHEPNNNGFKSTGVIRTSIRGYGKFGGTIEHKSLRNGFETSAAVETPFSNYRNFEAGMKHEGQLSQFRSNVNAKLPFSAIRSFDATVHHQGDLSDFTSGADVTYNDKAIEADITFAVSRGRNVDMNVGIHTPFQMLRHVAVTASHTGHASGQGTCKFGLSHNERPMANAEYTYVQGNSAELTFALMQPRAMKATVNFVAAGEQKKIHASINWDESKRDCVAAVDIELKNLVSGGAVDRNVRVTATLPRRVVIIGGGYAKRGGEFSHKGELQWSRAANDKVEYEVVVTHGVGAGHSTTTNGRVTIRSALGVAVMALENEYVPGYHYETTVKIQQMVIKHMLKMATRGAYMQKLTIQHPEMKRDAVVSIDYTEAGSNVDCKMMVQYAKQDFQIVARILDQSAGASNCHYIYEVGITNPIMSLDANVKAELLDNHQKMAAYITGHYTMSRDNSVKNVEWRTEIDKIRKELSLKIVTPIRGVQVTARKTFTDAINGMHRFQVVGESGAAKMTAEAEIDLHARSIKMKCVTPVGNTMNIYGHYVDPSNIKLEAHRQVHGERIQDANIAIGVNKNRRVTADSYIRPGVISDLGSMASTTQLTNALGDSWRQFSRAAAQDFRLKGRRWTEAWEPIMTAVTWFTSAANAYIERLAAIASHMMSTNEFYSRDIYNALEHYIVACKSAMADFLVNIKHVYATQMTHMQGAYGLAAAGIRRQAARFVPAIGRMTTKAQMMLNSAKPYLDLAVRKYAHVVQTCIDKIDHFGQTLGITPRMRAMIAPLFTGDTLNIVGFLRKCTMAAAHVISALCDDVMNKFAAIRGVWLTVMENPIAEWLADAVEGVIMKTGWSMDYVNLKARLANIINALATEGMLAVTDFAWHSLNRVFHFEDASFTWNPAAGMYGVGFFSPIPIADLWSFPSIQPMQYVKDAQAWATAYLPRVPVDKWFFSDLFYTYKPSSNIYDMFPPFKAHATLAGQQQFMTFDRKFYRFAGECSYLLASDFINGKFAVIVNYAAGAHKSITVITGTHKFEVFPDGKVQMNGRQVEMPIAVAGTVIQRLGHRLAVENANGVNVICDLLYDRCTVQVSGWYYGKTGGLMGTYDNEPATDMMASDRTTAADFAHLADSWTVGRRCRVANQARDIAGDALTMNGMNSRRYRLCAAHFVTDESPYRACFPVVDPAPFLSMCLNDMQTNVNRIETVADTCAAGAFYVDECVRMGVPITLPSKCVACTKYNGGHFYEGDSVQLTGNNVPKMADVVFVMQHSTCNKDVYGMISGLLVNLEKAMKARRLIDVRYGIVGFGGEGVLSSPHMHTLDGQIMNTRDKVLLGLDDWNMQAGAYEDPLLAVNFAANYPFRTGASKTIVLLSCDNCREMTVTYADTQRMLLARDIRLHVLKPYDIRLRTRSPKAGHIFGVDSQSVFTHKHVRNLNGDMSLRKHVIVPKDLCVAISMDTDGMTMNTLKWTASTKRGVQKRFVDVLVRLIAKKAAPTGCQICECVADGSGGGTSICRACQSSFFGGMLPGSSAKLNNTTRRSKGRQAKSKKRTRDQRRSQGNKNARARAGKSRL